MDSINNSPEKIDERGAMPKKNKEKKENAQITVRLEFEGNLHDLMREFRFGRKFDSYKAATMDLIETGLIAWKKARDADSKSPSDGAIGAPQNKNPPAH